MVTAETRFGVRSEEIAYKTLDGETIIINLVNGVYYSLPGVGSEVWELIATGRSLAESAANGKPIEATISPTSQSVTPATSAEQAAPMCQVHQVSSDQARERMTPMFSDRIALSGPVKWPMR